MIKIARLSKNDLQDLFLNTARHMGVQSAVVEKDFWVCVILDYLFKKSPWKTSMAFKGGTSLSKSFNLINRFSEDVDIILDWRLLGYSIKEPWQDRSIRKQNSFNKDARRRTEAFLKHSFCPNIQKGLSKVLGNKVEVFIDNQNEATVSFAYPRLFDNSGILQVIRLEIGVLSAWTPTVSTKIEPFIAHHYPSIFENQSTNVLSVTAERTFWEKATILHREANRPKNSKVPQRYARHYYDLYRMSSTPVKTMAFQQANLLNQVVAFKMKFYHQKWAQYENAIKGTLRLVPPEYRFNELKADFNTMRDMLFGNIPTFATIMETLVNLEKEFNV